MPDDPIAATGSEPRKPRFASRARLGAQLLVAALAVFVGGDPTLPYGLAFGALAAAAIILGVTRGAAAGTWLAALFVSIRAAHFALSPSRSNPYAAIAMPGLAFLAWAVALAGEGGIGRARRAALGLSIVGVAAFLAFGAAELVSNRFQPRDPYTIEPEPGSASADLYRMDHELLRTHHPGFRGRFTHPEFRGELVEINADGFRDEPWPADPIVGETRVLFLGDSTLFGFGAQRQETIPALAAAELARLEPSRRWRALNAGVASYGPRHEAVLLRRIDARAKPSVVVVVFYDGNDLEDSRVQFLLARDLGLESGLLASERASGERGSAPVALDYSWARKASLLERRYWTRTSAFFRLVDDRLGPLLVRAGLLDPTFVFNDTMLRAMKKVPDPVTVDELELAEGALEAIAARCGEIGAGCVVARLPAKIQSEPIFFEELVSDLGLARDSFDRTLPGAAIGRHCAAKGIPFVDLLPVLETRERRSNPNYFQEGHPSPRGNEVIARTLAPAILAASKTR